MYCRKCGKKIDYDDDYCPYCGVKVANVTNDISIEEDKIQPEPSTILKDNSAYEGKRWEKAIRILLIGMVIVIVGFVIYGIASSYTHNKTCDYYSCKKAKVEGGNYCYEHTCMVTGCHNLRGSNIRLNLYYCNDHKCEVYDCENKAIEGGEYCEDHTCTFEGCMNRSVGETNRCNEHQINMRDRIKVTGLWFTLNSAGGIQLDFSAQNKSGKTIKYIRFKVYMKNRAGDSVNDDIRNKNYCEVEIIGPFKNGENIYYNHKNKIIGYCDNLHRIDIRDVTIVYSDGSTEIGGLYYYYEKPTW